MSETADLKDKTKDQSTLYVAISTLVLGVLVVFYMQVLSTVSHNQIKEDPLEKTAKLICQKIAKEKIKSKRFGDLSPSDIDELKAAIRSAYLFAQSTGQAQAIDSLVLQDLDELQELESALAQNLQQAISETGSITNFAIEEYKSRLPAQSNLFSLKISMGSNKEKDPQLSDIKVTNCDKLSSFCQSGFYKTNFAVELKTLSCTRQIFFHKYYDKTEIFEPEQFVYVTPEVIPSTITIEAVIEQNDNTSATRRIMKQTCATIALNKRIKPRMCFAFRFPQGLPESIKLIDFLDSKTWLQNGEWYQATNGPVPKRGQLGPAHETSLLNQNPAQALNVALYHWLRQNHSHNNLDPEDLKKLLSSSIKPIEQFPKARVNSCLLQNTLLPSKKDPTKQDWQRGLYDLFEFQENQKELPADAFPIVIDSTGKANIAGRNIYDSKLIRDYLNALYKTNLAALETLEISKLVMGNTKAQIIKLKKDLLAKEQEFKALSLKSKKDSVKIWQLENIETTIKNDNENIEQLNRQYQIARLALRNAQIALLRTYDLASHNLNVCRNGLHKIDNYQGKFLLSRKDVFTSCEYPISDQQLIEQAKNKKTAESESIFWLAKDFNILSSWQNLNSEDTIDSKPLDMVLAEEENINTIQPLTILLTNENVYSSYSPFYVFSGLPVSEDQLFYYSSLCFSKQENVFWSLSIRDLVSMSKPGQPLEARSQAQFVKTKFTPNLDLQDGLYPLMAGEFQLRRPIVKDLSELSGTVLRDPSWKKESPIIPPIPLDML